MSLYDDLVRVTNKAKEDVVIKSSEELINLTSELTGVMYENAAKLKTSIIYNVSSLKYPALFTSYQNLLRGEGSITTLLAKDLQGILGEELNYKVTKNKQTEYIVEINWENHERNKDKKEINEIKELKDWGFQ